MYLLLALLIQVHAQQERTARSDGDAAPPAEGPKMTKEQLLSANDNKIRKCIGGEGPITKPSCEVAKIIDADPVQLPNEEKFPIDGDLEGTKAALKKQIAYCDRLKNQDEKIRFGNHLYTRKQMCGETSRTLLGIANQAKDYKEYLRRTSKELDWYQFRCMQNDGNIRMTGFYTPEVEGSEVQTPRFNCPIYGKPKDLYIKEEIIRECEDTPAARSKREKSYHRILENGSLAKNSDGTLANYYTREEINTLNLMKTAKPLAWVECPWAAADIQIQGTGIVKVMEHGKEKKRIQLNFAGKNGYKWKGIGKTLKCMGVDRKYLSMKGIGQWLKENPYMAEAVLNTDPSYVFFEADEKPPQGAPGIALDGQRSVAVDDDLIKMGSTLRYSADKGGTPFQTMGFAHDTGGAIKGCRADIYWGEGDGAAQVGGNFESFGPMFIGVAHKK